MVRVSPGWVETEAAVRLVTELANKTGTDYEVADLVAYLASPRAAAITGAEFVIDGGTLPIA